MAEQEDNVKVSLDESFWEHRYQTNETGWDIGHCSTPLKAYFDQLSNKAIKILIPGCGNAYEAEYLFEQGFTNVHVIDLAASALAELKRRLPSFPANQLINGDFFQLNNSFDLIVEQTFFCAIHPKKREDYVKKAADLLRPDGKLVGLLFDDELNTEHPPFGGSKEEYVPLFDKHFELLTMEKAYNSIEPRQGRELFVILKKK